MCWLWLFLAIVLEVTATVCLKLSDGFSRFLPTALMALFYGASFFPMAVALRRLDVGIAYAVWSAVGTALMTIVGVLVFKEAASLLKLSAIVMIMVGVVCLNVASRMPRAKGRDSGNTISARSDMALSRMARAVNVGGEGLLQVSPQSPQRAEPRWGPRLGRTWETQQIVVMKATTPLKQMKLEWATITEMAGLVPGRNILCDDL